MYEEIIFSLFFNKIAFLVQCTCSGMYYLKRRLFTVSSICFLCYDLFEKQIHVDKQYKFYLPLIRLLNKGRLYLYSDIHQRRDVAMVLDSVSYFRCRGVGRLL